MSAPEVVAIAAVARNGVIGAGNRIPWHLPEDLRRFRRLTTGQVLVMGRRTYDSIGRPLPGRTTVVVTRDPDWRADGVQPVASLPAALDLAQSLRPRTVYVAGGGQIYAAAWDLLDRLEVTEVDGEPAGDAWFPPIDVEQWRETAREDGEGYRFVTYRRRPS